jgi:hypothetical protein
LRTAGLHALSGELQAWRSAVDLRALEASRGSALVLPFVRGLRLSARLVYVLRKDLSWSGLEVDWGHLLDDRGASCSPECDIIIHRTGLVERWDGDSQAVMDFKFVQRKLAVAVVSCKSLVDAIDRDYVRKLRPYVGHIFLFAECCAPTRVTSLKRRAREAGYAGFGYLYTFDEATSECVNDQKAWLAFLDAVAAKVRRAVRTR